MRCAWPSTCCLMAPGAKSCTTSSATAPAPSSCRAAARRIGGLAFGNSRAAAFGIRSNTRRKSWRRYFLVGRQVVRELLDAHGLEPGDIDVVLPTGINRTSWNVLLRLLEIPDDRLYRGPESFGHTISADSFIQLEHLRRHHPASGHQKVLMFTYGFGSSWCALLLEH